MKAVCITLLMVDGVLTTFLGAGKIDNLNTGEVLATCDIIHNAQDRIGKIYYYTYVSKTFDNKEGGNGQLKTRKGRSSGFDELRKQEVQPEFRFRKLGRPINW